MALISGASGIASTFSWLEPLRPYLIGTTVLVLGFAWYQKGLRPEKLFFPINLFLLMSNNIFLLIGLTILVSASCSDTKQAHWVFKEQIPLSGIASVGIVHNGANLWLSDPDHKRLVKIGPEGEVLEEIPGFQRPMHIAFSAGKLYVPEYLTDTVRVLEKGSPSFLPLAAQLNAPAGIAVKGDTLAVADFYNHRVVERQRSKEISIGKEGHSDGELHYPTDVDIHDKLILSLLIRCGAR